MVSPCGGTGVVTAQSLWNFGEQVANGGGFAPNTWFSCVSFNAQYLQIIQLLITIYNLSN
jgi:hypothetical protein